MFAWLRLQSPGSARSCSIATLTSFVCGRFTLGHEWIVDDLGRWGCERLERMVSVDERKATMVKGQRTIRCIVRLSFQTVFASLLARQDPNPIHRCVGRRLELEDVESL